MAGALLHIRPGFIRGSRLRDIITSGLPAGIRVGAHSVALITLNALVMGTVGATAMAAFSVQQDRRTGRKPRLT